MEETEDIKENQKVLTRVAKKSMFILNVTRIELAKNRVNINWLMQNVVVNITESVMTELKELGSFVQQYFHLLPITTRVRYTSHWSLYWST